MAQQNDKMAYYPGCSMDGLGKAYEKSTAVVFEDLNIPMNRIKDYNCCGATEVKNISYDLSVFLPGRNLALAQEMGATSVIAPCNGCVYALARTNKSISEDPSTKERMNSYLTEAGVPGYSGEVEVKHILEVIRQSVGLDEVSAKVKRPLTGLKVACYYGCLYTRPKVYTGAGMSAEKDNPERPHFMDDLLKAAGATVVDYPVKTICCGGGHTIADREVSVGFSAAILNEAARAGADVVATMCPLGQVNIEMNIPMITEKYGAEIVRPVVYFTQLLGLSFGHSRREMAIQENISDANGVLKKLGY